MSVEIELRAHVSSPRMAAIRQLMLTATSCTKQARSFIDYSTFLEGIGERKLDVRVRVTNGVPEIVVKRGQFGGAVRHEAGVSLDPADLEKVLELMALLGYSKGVLGGRRIHRAKFHNVEVALQEVLDCRDPTVVGDVFVEVEYLGAAIDHTAAERELRQFLAAYELEPFTVDQWNSYVKSLNEKWNGVYEHGVTPADDVRALGS